jgi:hypothetical protein
VTTLADLWQRHAGKPVAILGNGWSLARTLPHAIPTPRIGLNRVWRHCLADYWLCIDVDVAEEAAADPDAADLLTSSTRVISADVQGIVGPNPGDLVTGLGRIDDRVGLLHRDAVSLEFCRTGRYPGQRLRGRQPPPDTLWGENSSGDRAIHLALLMGAAEVHLFGVDLAHEPGTRRRRFCDAPPFRAGMDGRDLAAAESSEQRSRGQLVRNRRNLERVAAMWRDDVRLVCHSPAAALDGWENPNLDDGRRR